jgi:hypothetical protein
MPRFNIDDETYTTLAGIVGVERDQFTVADAMIDKGLYLLHFDTENIRSSKDGDAVRELRGTIVDIDTKEIVCASFGFIPTAVLGDETRIKAIFKENETFTDCAGNDYNLDKFEEDYQSVLENTDFTYDVFPLYEGTMIRVWKHKGELMISSHKKIDCSKSHWGSSGEFKNLFLEYTNGYNLGDYTNNFMVHYFILMNEDLLVCSKFPMANRKGLVIYVGTRDKQNMNIGKAGWMLINKLKLPTLSNDEIHNGTGTFYAPDLITKYSEVSKLLTKGFYSHPAVEQSNPLCLGEAIVVSYNSGGRRKHVRIVSPAYKHRSELVDNNPNILHRCYTLLTKTLYPKTGEDTYLQEFPSISVVDVEKTTLPIINEYEGRVYSDEELTNKSDIESHSRRYRNAVMHYVLALALPHQASAVRCLDYVIEERKKIINILTTNFQRFKNGDFEGLTFKNDMATMNHIKHRLTEAEKFASVSNGNLKKNIRLGVLRDTGEWVFKMARLLIEERY